MDATDSTPPQPLTLQEMVAKYFTPDDTPQARLMTTTDIFATIDDHVPGRYIIAELYDVLTALQFRARAIGDVIYWSLRMR